MLSARELIATALQQVSAPSWVNQRLKYTHGYGVTMSLVSAIAEEGRPKLVTRTCRPAAIYR